MRPLFGSALSADTADDIGTLVQHPAAKASAVGIDDTHRQGIGCHVEEIIRVIQHQTVDIAAFQMLQIASQAKDLCRIVSAQIAAASAIGCKITDQELTHTAAQRDPYLSADQAQGDPDQDAHKTDIHGSLAPEVIPVGNVMDQPGRDHAKYGKYDSQNDLEGQDHRHIQRHADTAQNLGHAGDATEQPDTAGIAFEHIPLAGNDFLDFPAEFCVSHAGGIHHSAVAEENAEDLVFKLVALVAHIHPLMEHDPSVFVHVDQDVAKLRPGEDHHGQIAAGQNQTAAQLTGGDTFRSCGRTAADQRQGTQEQDPVKESQNRKTDDIGKLRVAFAHVGADGGEHFFPDEHGHGDAFMVVQDGFAGADDLAAGNGLQDQIGTDTFLPVDTGKLGILRQQIARHGDHEVQVFHRILKSVQNGQGQL